MLGRTWSGKRRSLIERMPLTSPRNLSLADRWASTKIMDGTVDPERYTPYEKSIMAKVRMERDIIR